MNNNAGGRVGGKIRGQHCIFGGGQPNSVGGMPPLPPPLATGLKPKFLIKWGGNHYPLYTQGGYNPPV